MMSDKRDIPPSMMNMFQATFSEIDEELLLGLARSNPDFLLGILKSMDAQEVIQAVENNKEFFMRVVQQFPPDVTGRIIRELPELAAALVEQAGPDFVFGIDDISR